MSKSSKLLS